MVDSWDVDVVTVASPAHGAPSPAQGTYYLPWLPSEPLHARFYPPHTLCIPRRYSRKVNNTLPWALLLHLCFTCWFLGTESLKSEVITESMSRAAPYEELLSYYEEKFGILVRGCWEERSLACSRLPASIFSRRFQI